MRVDQGRDWGSERKRKGLDDVTRQEANGISMFVAAERVEFGVSGQVVMTMMKGNANGRTGAEVR